MNREEASLSLQVAINQMISAVAALLCAESVPDGDITIAIRENEDELTILSNGTVIYDPKQSEGTLSRKVKAFSNPTHVLMRNPKYPPVKRTEM